MAAGPTKFSSAHKLEHLVVQATRRMHFVVSPVTDGRSNTRQPQAESLTAAEVFAKRSNARVQRRAAQRTVRCNPSVSRARAGSA